MRNTSERWIILATALLFFAPTPRQSRAQALEITAELPGAAYYVSAYEFVVSPDGQWVVFKASPPPFEMGGSPRYELYAVRPGGGEVVRLPDFGGDKTPAWKGFRVTADSKRVVLLQEGWQDIIENPVSSWLGSTPLGEGDAVVLQPKLPGSIHYGGFTTDFQLAPDGSRVVFRMKPSLDVHEMYSIYELYSVSPLGGEAVKLNVELTTSGVSETPLSPSGVGRVFRISPDGGRVVYQCRRVPGGPLELYSVPLLGGESVRLNPTLVEGGNVTNQSLHLVFTISSDSSRVVYVADQETDEEYELYSVPWLGGDAVKLNPPLGVGEDRRILLGGTESIKISSDNRYVIFPTYDQEGIPVELLSVPLLGGDAVKLNPAPKGRISSMDCFITPDGGRVVYLAEQDSATVKELYSVPIGGGEVVKLSPPLGPTTVLSRSPVFSPDGQYVYFGLGADDPEGSWEIWRAPVGGGEGTAPLNPLDLYKEGAMDFTADGSRLVHNGHETIDSGRSYYVMAADGSAARRLCTMPTDFDVEGERLLTPDDAYFIFGGKISSQAPTRLYSVRVGGLTDADNAQWWLY